VYVRQEVIPVLQAGFMPPIAAGFSSFLATSRVAAASREIVDAAESNGQTDLFDTHPSLRHRLAALGSTNGEGLSADDSEPAYKLINGLETQAHALAEFAFGADTMAKLKRVDWESVADSVYAAGWRDLVKEHSAWLSRYTADGLPIGKPAFIRLGSDLVRSDEENINSDVRIARAAHVITAGIGVLLLDRGWHAHTTPGMPLLVVRGSETFDPADSVRQLADEAITQDAWKVQCQSVGIAGLRLGLHGIA